MIGTCARSISTPRSPRATISPSLWATIWSISARASDFSILAMMWMSLLRRWRCQRSIFRSSGLRTNDNAR